MKTRFYAFGAVAIPVAIAACGGGSSDAPVAPPVVHHHVAGAAGTGGAAGSGGAAGAAGASGAAGKAGAAGASGAAGAGGSAGAAGASGSGGSSAGAGGAVDPDPLVAASSGYGEVSLDLRHLGSSAAETAITAKFVNGAMRGGTCTETPLADASTCVTRVCTPQTESGPFPDAGVITIGGTLATGPVFLTPAMSVYDGYSDIVALFQGGETLTISAAGHGVPAFNDSIVAPAAPTFTAPAASPTGDAISFSSAADVPVAWSVASGNVVVELSATSEQTNAVTTIRCVFPASPASATVPKAAIDTLAAVSTSGSYALFGESTKDITAGPQTVTLVAVAHGLASASPGLETAGSAVFQGSGAGGASGGSGGASGGSGGADSGGSGGSGGAVSGGGGASQGGDAGSAGNGAGGA